MTNGPIEISQETFNQYLKLHYNPTTIKSYLTLYNKFERILNNNPNEPTYEDFITHYIIDPQANPLYKGFIKAFQECFNTNLEIPKSHKKYSKQIKEYKFLTLNEIKQLINNTPTWISILIRIYFDTGLRLRELINTTKKNINLQERTIQGIGKGNKKFTVKFSEKTKQYLQEYLNHNNNNHPFWESDDKPIDYGRKFWRKLKEEGKKIGIENVHPHRIRHALGHHLRIDRKWDLIQIKTKLRHSKLDTTEIYSVATQKEVDDLFDQQEVI